MRSPLPLLAAVLLAGCPSGDAPNAPSSPAPVASSQTPETAAPGPKRVAGPSFAGTFVHKRLGLTLSKDGESYVGTLSLRRHPPFPATGRVEGQVLVGSFTAKGRPLPFRASRVDGGLSLECDGKTYQLVEGELPVALAAAGGAARLEIVEGTFSGPLNGSTAELLLERQGDGLRGSAVDGNGYRYTVEATLVDGRIRGAWVDPAKGESLPFELEPSESGLDVIFEAEGHVRLPFVRGPSGAARQQVGLDPVVLGTWIRDADETKRITLELRADGTYTYGHSRSAAPASGWTGSTASGQLIGGRWKSAEGALHVQPAGQAEWSRFAGYGFEDERLILTFDETGTEVWRRP